MFTGIIENLARLKTVEPRAQGRECVWEVETGFSDLALGESIAMLGVCLTVAEIVEVRKGCARFFISEETLRCTILGQVQPGQLLNLERAMALGARLSGHWVQGHVDGVGRLTRIDRDKGAESVVCEVALPPELLRYCADKGSITVNGVSLTVNRVEASRGCVEIRLIPHTWEHTHFKESVVGEGLNIEVDVLAKYMERLCQPYLQRLKP